MSAIGRPARILCVCNHNRTRSVLMAAILRRTLDACSPPGEFCPMIADVGFGPPGMPVTQGVVAQLAEMGIRIDPLTHVSRSLTDRIAEEADLILAAEVSNVVGVSTRARELFPRTFTLPEFVARAAAVGPRSGSTLESWLRLVGEGRRASDYLQADVAEILDPTGAPDGAIARCAAEIDLLCRRFAELWQ